MNWNFALFISDEFLFVALQTLWCRCQWVKCAPSKMLEGGGNCIHPTISLSDMPPPNSPHRLSPMFRYMGVLVSLGLPDQTSWLGERNYFWSPVRWNKGAHQSRGRAAINSFTGVRPWWRWQLNNKPFAVFLRSDEEPAVKWNVWKINFFLSKVRQ